MNEKKILQKNINIKNNNNHKQINQNLIQNSLRYLIINKILLQKKKKIKIPELKKLKKLM